MKRAKSILKVGLPINSRHSRSRSGYVRHMLCGEVIEAVVSRDVDSRHQRGDEEHRDSEPVSLLAALVKQRRGDQERQRRCRRVGRVAEPAKRGRDPGLLEGARTAINFRAPYGAVCGPGLNILLI